MENKLFRQIYINSNPIPNPTTKKQPKTNTDNFVNTNQLRQQLSSQLGPTSSNVINNQYNCSNLMNVIKELQRKNAELIGTVDKLSKQKYQQQIDNIQLRKQLQKLQSKCIQLELQSQQQCRMIKANQKEPSKPNKIQIQIQLCKDQEDNSQLNQKQLILATIQELRYIHDYIDVIVHADENTGKQKQCEEGLNKEIRKICEANQQIYIAVINNRIKLEELIEKL